MANPRNVMRKRRGISIRNKLWEYATLFDLNVALVIQDKRTGQYEVYQAELDENFPPARSDFVRLL
ncbi:hypothetical protein F5X98DRAFT_340001, partial [Xylaria grammica]